MSDLVLFLTSREIMVVYLISGITCFISLIVYMVRKSSESVRRKHNTEELNKLVEQVRDRVPQVEETISYDVPILEVMEEVPSVSDMLEKSFPQKDAIEVLEDTSDSTTIHEEFEYTTIEPNPEEARLELERLTRELEEAEKQEESDVIQLTNYEEEQEATAIISMEELLRKAKSLYETNEVNSYQDDGNEPISIQDLEERVGKKVTPIVEEVPEIIETIPVTKPVQEEVRKFKSSPIISPIFGIEKEATDNDLALENTANYEKLDEQIQKSSEFVMSLSEFQKNIE